MVCEVWKEPSRLRNSGIIWYNRFKHVARQEGAGDRKGNIKIKPSGKERGVVAFGVRRKEFRKPGSPKRLQPTCSRHQLLGARQLDCTAGITAFGPQSSHVMARTSKGWI